MVTVQLAIEGMHCDGCVKRVTQALTKAGGVPEEVKVGSARVSVEEGKTPALVAALEKMGFDARVADGGGR
jgi:copper chaperone CopZ